MGTMTVVDGERVFTAGDLGVLPRLPGEARRELVDGRIEIHHRGDGFTESDYDAMPDPTDGKLELVDGVVVVTPGPLNRHEGVLGNLYLLVRAAAGPEHRVRFSVFDVRLEPGGSIIKPDLLVAHRESLSERALEGAPVLAVEILSRSTRSHDLRVKRARLEAAGCPSYWVIEPGRGEVGPTLTVLELVDGSYVEVAEVTGVESWTATQPFPVTIVPDELVDD